MHFSSPWKKDLFFEVPYTTSEKGSQKNFRKNADRPLTHSSLAYLFCRSNAVELETDWTKIDERDRGSVELDWFGLKCAIVIFICADESRSRLDLIN